MQYWSLSGLGRIVAQRVRRRRNINWDFVRREVCEDILCRRSFTSYSLLHQLR
jgi:hypothetical protein